MLQKAVVMDPATIQQYKTIDPSAMAQTPPKDLFGNALGAHHVDGQNSQSGLSPGSTPQVMIQIVKKILLFLQKNVILGKKHRITVTKGCIRLLFLRHI